VPITNSTLAPVPDQIEASTIDQRQDLPLVVQPGENMRPRGADALVSLWAQHRQWLDTRLHLHGAILFRGFGIAEQDIFENVIAHLNKKPLDYQDGNSPRTKVSSGIYTSTEYPPEYFISLHNELSYSAQWPARLFFCCVLEPEQGGETPLVNSRSLLRNLPPSLLEQFRSRKVKYIRYLHGGQGFGPSWQKAFQTSNRVDVQVFAEASGMELHWKNDGSVSVSNVRPATAIHPETGEEVWFNQADQFHPSTHPPAIYRQMLTIYKGRENELPQNVAFGDGSPIPLEYLETVRQTTRNQLILFPWRKGDLLMVDNMLVAHGRMPFKGLRRILVSMTAQSVDASSAAA
jgi:alpha-ketoglutarate-dependent taurine dioxygenase